MNTRRIKTEFFEALPNDLLSQRETETLVEIALGNSNKKIALAMGVTVDTARTYMGRVNEKLEVNDKAAAVCRAFCLGILKPLCLLLVASQVALTLGLTSNQPTRPVRNQPRVVRVVRSGRSITELSEIRV